MCRKVCSSSSSDGANARLPHAGAPSVRVTPPMIVLTTLRPGPGRFNEEMRSGKSNTLVVRRWPATSGRGQTRVVHGPARPRPEVEGHRDTKGQTIRGSEGKAFQDRRGPRATTTGAIPLQPRGGRGMNPLLQPAADLWFEVRARPCVSVAVSPRNSHPLTPRGPQGTGPAATSLPAERRAMWTCWPLRSRRRRESSSALTSRCRRTSAVSSRRSAATWD